MAVYFSFGVDQLQESKNELVYEFTEYELIDYPTQTKTTMALLAEVRLYGRNIVCGRRVCIKVSNW